MYSLEEFQALTITLYVLQTYEDRDGNLMIPLQRRRPGAVIPEPGLKYSTRHP